MSAHFFTYNKENVYYKFIFDFLNNTFGRLIIFIFLPSNWLHIIHNISIYKICNIYICYSILNDIRKKSRAHEIVEKKKRHTK